MCDFGRLSLSRIFFKLFTREKLQKLRGLVPPESRASGSKAEVSSRERARSAE